jgi:transposase
VDQKTSQHTAAPAARTTTTCACCGTTQQGLPLTWICSVENGRRVYFCDRCGREHLRSIEGRLDSAWW